MKRIEGKPLPVGVTIGKDSVNFSIAVPEKKTCQLLLYKAGEITPTYTFELKEEDAFGRPVWRSAFRAGKRSAGGQI